MTETVKNNKEEESVPIIKSIIVCSCQRSGSSLFCEAIGNTGYAGMPREYFLEMEEGEWALENGINTRQEYLELVKNNGTTPNGVFGIKIMWNYFEEAMNKIRDIEDFEGLESQQIIETLFPNPRYIWVVRRDKTAQAVSWAIAAKSGKYSSKQKATTDKEPEFDFDLIDNLYRLIEESESGWKNYFNDIGVEPTKIVYEDFVSDYEGNAIQTLQALSIETPDSINFGNKELKKQSKSINNEWIKRYKAIKGAEER